MNTFSWSMLCENARFFGLDTAEFAKLEPFFQQLDKDFFAECAEKVIGNFPFQKVTECFKSGELEKFHLLCIIANYQKVVELYRTSGWPEDSLQEILSDLKCWEPVMLRDLGYLGLSQRLFIWAQACLNGEVKQFGRLQCNDIHLFALKLSLYRQADGTLKEFPAFQKGNPASPDLTYGDKTINIHIPARGPLKADECMASFRRMSRFCQAFYPDYDYKAIVCYSWLLDPQFKEFLPETSNIVQFQKLGHNLICPGRDETREVIWRIWGVPGLSTPIDQLPARNAMERGVVDFLKQGRRFQEGLLVIFKDELL